MKRRIPNPRYDAPFAYVDAPPPPRRDRPVGAEFAPLLSWLADLAASLMTDAGSVVGQDGRVWDIVRTVCKTLAALDGPFPCDALSELQAFREAYESPRGWRAAGYHWPKQFEDSAITIGAAITPELSPEDIGCPYSGIFHVRDAAGEVYIAKEKQIPAAANEYMQSPGHWLPLPDHWR